MIKTNHPVSSQRRLFRNFESLQTKKLALKTYFHKQCMLICAIQKLNAKRMARKGFCNITLNLISSMPVILVYRRHRQLLKHHLHWHPHYFLLLNFTMDTWEIYTKVINFLKFILKIFCIVKHFSSRIFGKRLSIESWDLAPRVNRGRFSNG